MTLLDHARAQERDDAAAKHQKDEKHGLLITNQDATFRRMRMCMFVFAALMWKWT